ncbi:hypothetical protein KKG72_08015 [bacterium]|nr:hypothetical protein [bacterium]MBU1994580.1 hypothetical protein [bacterium]
MSDNSLSSLCDSMAACVNIELLRLSANELCEIPSWLLKLSKLSWLAFSGEGASGEIFKGYSKDLGKEVALRVNTR